MTSLQFLTLILHVFLGIAAVVCSCAVWMMLLKQKPNVAKLRSVSGWAFLFTFLSWITAGYYYVTYYGTNIKAGILASKYAWAHSVLTESKEHFFLFLPFLTLILWLLFWAAEKQILREAGLQRAITMLAGITAILGIAAALFGVGISGAVR